MEGLMERLERAVTRLEKMSVTMQASNGMANGDCLNGIDGGKSLLESATSLWHFCIGFIFQTWRLLLQVSEQQLLVTFK